MTTLAARPGVHRGAALLLALGILASVLVAASPAAPAGAADDVVFTMGTKQPVDNMNPNVGLTLSAYEVWNLQYNVLANLSAADMGPIPDLATSWQVSPDGLTWTYKLRDGLKWSDGKPLTAEDARYTFARMKKEQWANFYSFLEDFKSIEAPDATTLVITTKTPNPSLPNLPVYVLPKHVWKKYGPDDVGSFANRDPVVSGPFRLTAWDKSTSWEMSKNPNYYGTPANVDTVRFRIFKNDEAMSAALRNGEVDAIYNLAPSLAKTLDQSNITRSDAQDGSFTQLTINTGGGKFGNGHPALKDVRVRQAIAHAIDKDTLVKRVLNGLGVPGQSMNVAVAPKWNLTVPPDQTFEWSIPEANRILDEAGYKRGSDGVRRMPDGSDPLKMRLIFPSESGVYSRSVQFIKEWLQQIGISTTVAPKSDDELTALENQGKFDFVVWAWTPFTDPSPMMSYLTCSNVPKKPNDGQYNDSFFCNQEYDRLYNEQRIELNEATRIDLVKQAQQVFYTQAPYVVLFLQDTVNAYRNDRFTGFVRQPEGNGAIYYSQSDPSYVLIRAVGSGTSAGSKAGDDQQASGSDDGDGDSNVGLFVGIGIAVIIVAGGIYLLTRRRQTADERE